MSEFVCPPDHKHDENSTCYVQHRCRCSSCRERSRDYAYWRRHSGCARTRIDATGTRRRLQGLACLGWTFTELGERLGTTRQAVQNWAKADTVWPATAQRITALFAELCMTVPAHPPGYAAGTAERVRIQARKNDWVPPLAWDDDDIDNPDARPAIWKEAAA